VLRPRTRAALDAVRAHGSHVIVVTGRMFQSARRYLTGPEPVVCYQGALVADPVSGEFLLHVPIPVELAREAIAAIQDSGHGLNCYVDDELYVAAKTPEAESYASFQHIELRVVGPLLDWLERPPTKLVVVGEPERLDVLGAKLRAHFDGRLFIAKSLPFFLELAHPDVSKGSGLQFVADRLGFTPAETVACGDGENDRELLDWAGFGVAVANAHKEILARAKLVVPSVDDEGVALLFDAYLDSAS
jgi:Cof subfamily protein (haloacid dehalogenase superfamily)